MKRFSWLWIGIAALVLLLGGIWLGMTGGSRYGYGGMMGGPGGAWGIGFPYMGLVGGLVMLLFWGLVIAGIVWLVQSAIQGRQPPADTGSASESPLDILKRRYASGEITKEQFEEMKRNLGF